MQAYLIFIYLVLLKKLIGCSRIARSSSAGFDLSSDLFAQEAHAPHEP